VNQPMPADGSGYLGYYNHMTWVLKKPGNVSGTGTLAWFDFTVAGTGFTKIDIILSGAMVAALADPNDVDLDFNTIDIVFDNRPLAPPANIYVDPPTSTAEAINDTFKVNITISDANLLVSWQAGMNFNPNVLQCLAFEEGDFLSNVGATVAKRLGGDAEIDNLLGEVKSANCSLIETSLSANGTGTLATVTFKVKDYGISTLSITDVMLLDVNGEQILFNAVDGNFVSLLIVSVPTDYPTIQEAVDSVSPGQTIHVAAGTYYEHVTINKSLALDGEEGAIIDGNGSGKVIYITTNNVNISGFTIQNGNFGIYMKGSNNTIVSNTISNNWCGIYMVNSKNNSISDNIITSNDMFGIRMFGPCNHNIIISNVFANSKKGISLTYPKNNTFYHNNITNNAVQLGHYMSSNTWNNRAGEGNYWSDYTGLDDGSDGRVAGDGIGDTDLPHQGVDYYPLMGQLDKDIEPPQAEVGVNQIVNEDTLVNFDGSGSTDDTGITSYDWNFGDGNTGTGVTPTHIYTEPGIYTVKLTVWDEADNEDTDSCTITVLDVTPPVANAGSNQTIPKGTFVTFNGGGSYDPENGTIVKFEWHFKCEIIGTLKIANYTFEELGTYTVTLTVWDAGPWRNGTDPLRNDTASCTVTVTGFDVEPPKANAGLDQTVDEDTLVTFDGSGSTDNVGITSYTWTFTDVTLQTLTGVNPEYNFTRPATYTITLNVTDAAGYWAIDIVVIAVLDVTPPVADAGLDQTVDEDTVVTLTSAFCDSEGGTITKYKWEFGDGTEQSKSTSGNLEPGETVDHIYTEPGIYTVKLTVWDEADNEDTDSCTITVLDVTPPVANAGSNQTVEVGETMIFNGSGSTDNVDIVSYEWDFGDGATGTGTIVNHTYTEPGEYTDTLTVKDVADNSATDSITITVQEVPVGFPLWILGATAVGIAMIALAAFFVLGRRERATNEDSTVVARAFWVLRAGRQSKKNNN